ncbi:MAG: chemotaxis protein CheX [Planctomycetes bacterium]|nr:chemotaxis protein CheX [Planctomycetota bacterium]
MSSVIPGAECTLPPAIIDAVRASVEKTYPAFFSAKPVPMVGASENRNVACIAGIISFVGDVTWSFSWILTQETAPVLAKRFAGFDIPFDSADMGDMAGELVNVIAGEIVAQLEQRHIKAQMSVPTVARGKPLELVPESGPSIIHLEYMSPEGPFWLRLASFKGRGARQPGK